MVLSITFTGKHSSESCIEMFKKKNRKAKPEQKPKSLSTCVDQHSGSSGHCLLLHYDNIFLHNDPFAITHTQP